MGHQTPNLGKGPRCPGSHGMFLSKGVTRHWPWPLLLLLTPVLVIAGGISGKVVNSDSSHTHSISSVQGLFSEQLPF